MQFVHISIDDMLIKFSNFLPQVHKVLILIIFQCLQVLTEPNKRKDDTKTRQLVVIKVQDFQIGKV